MRPVLSSGAKQSIASAPLEPLSDGEFERFQALIHREAGIYLSSAKKALLVGRLSGRIRELGLRSFSDYHRLLFDGPGDETARMLDHICINETRFFRDPRQFEFLRRHVYPGWAAAAGAGTRSKRIRVWSAACSTGEEAYSIAMSLLLHFSLASWDLQVTATDLSTRALAAAQRALWPVERSSDIPESYLKPFMRRGIHAKAGLMTVGSEVREVVRFSRLNLHNDIFPVTRSFDLIFRRNALIYFSAAARARAIGRLLDRLAPGGLLVVGPAEGLEISTRRVRAVFTSIYTSSTEDH